MRVKYPFEIMELDESWIAVPVGEDENKLKGVIKLNGVACEIFKLLQEDTTEQNIVNEMMKDYNISQNDLAGHVHTFVEKLKKQGIVE